MRTQWLVALGVGALTVTACSSSGQKASPPSPPTSSISASPAIATAELICADTIQQAEPSSDMQVVANAVALPSLRMAALGAAPTGESGATALFAKYGLLIRAGTRATVTVADPAHVSIGWGKPGPVTKRLVIPGCGSSGWLAFAGGYYVDRPRCVTLEVASGASKETVQVGVGTACPGQRPPIGT